MPTDRRRRALAGWALVALLVAGCASIPGGRPQQVAEGYPALGRTLLADYGCVSCHHIPGLPQSDNAWVGPPLDHFGLRSYIAGSLPNDHENLVRWITDPQAIEPGTAMPDLGVSRDDAANIAAYLLSLD